MNSGLDYELGLGFVRRRENGEEGEGKKEKCFEKMKKMGEKPLLYVPGSG